MVHDLTWHDDETMQKVYSVLRSLGLQNGMSTEIVMRLQNNGILFREITPVVAEELGRVYYPSPSMEVPVEETYQDKARRIVIEHFNQIRDITDSDPLEYKDTYVVWFSKTLQNWKALVSTHVSDGRYYEVTYNGDKKVTYLDVYVKVVNQEIPD